MLKGRIPPGNGPRSKTDHSGLLLTPPGRRILSFHRKREAMRKVLIPAVPVVDGLRRSALLAVALAVAIFVFVTRYKFRCYESSPSD